MKDFKLNYEAINRLKKIAIIFFIVVGILVFFDNFGNVSTVSVNKFFKNEKNVNNTIKFTNKLLKSLNKKDKEKISYNTLDLNKDVMKFKKIDKGINNNPCLLMSLQKTNGVSFIIVYEKKFFLYEPLGIVDSFYKLDDIQLMPLKKENTNLILVRETVNQSSTAFRSGTFIRGYYYDDKFKLVLSLTEKYYTSYNEMWGSSNKVDTRWRKISTVSDIKWNDEVNPFVNVAEHQIYFISDEPNLIEPPEKDNYNVVNIKNFLETYTWSSSYKNFIIKEGFLKSDGSPIAILQNLAYNNFGQTGNPENYDQKYLVKNKKGDVGIVNYSDVYFKETKDIKVSK